MNYDSLKNRIQAIVCEIAESNDLPSSGLTVDTPLFDPSGLGLDSIASLDLVAVISDEFGNPFENITAADLLSIQTLTAYVHGVIGNKVAE